MINRVILIILDSAGIGALPDADKYGDAGSNTLVNTAKLVGGLNMQNMQSLGLGNIDKIAGIPQTESPIGFYGKMAEKSPGKDTTTGHWELAGIILDKPFPVYHDGFPPEIIAEFMDKTGLGILANYAASGTEIIKELGDEHVSTGKPIVYTSADSVFQIAAHEEIIPLNRLYEICGIAREICDKYNIGRVIARPFLGKDGDYYRTPNRRDFSIVPTKNTVLDMLKDAGENVVGIGKIEDIFAQRGITDAIHTKSNTEGMQKTKECLDNFSTGLIFTNLVEFDMLYGHRNDYKGYAGALEEFDQWLGGVLELLTEDDLLIITADHGCDPTTKSTDHSREYVPLIVYHKTNTNGKSLGVRSSFCDIGKTIIDIFNITDRLCGLSFLKDILKP